VPFESTFSAKEKVIHPWAISPMEFNVQVKDQYTRVFTSSCWGLYPPETILYGEATMKPQKQIATYDAVTIS
jgi:hypothetical protein